MSNVTDIASRRPNPHNSGYAKCIACQAEWMFVAPVGTIWLECPECKMQMGRMRGPCQENRNHYYCACDNDLFYISDARVYCGACGKEHHRFDGILT